MMTDNFFKEQFQSKLKGQTVCVTGADGFIGSHLTEALLSLGLKVKALVQYNSFNNLGWLEVLPEEYKQNVELIAGDVRDAEQMREFVSGCDTVFHLAALIAIPYSYVAPRSYVETNITGTLNILEGCRQNKNLKRLIVTSTSEVYGTAQFVPITEDHPLVGQSPYAATKIAADQLALSYYRSFELPVMVLRPFNTFGPRQSMRAVIPTVIRQALQSNIIKVGSLDPRRDFNYVKDTVYGFLLAATAADSICGDTVQVGTGHDISVRDLITTVENILGKSLDIIQDESRLRPDASEVMRLCASVEKAGKVLGYQPQYTLEEALRETIEWFSKVDSTPNEKVALYHR